jgi:hypothetical protein
VRGDLGAMLTAAGGEGMAAALRTACLCWLRGPLPTWATAVDAVELVAA